MRRTISIKGSWHVYLTTTWTYSRCVHVLLAIGRDSLCGLAATCSINFFIVLSCNQKWVVNPCMQLIAIWYSFAVPLSDKDVASLCEQLRPHARKWKEIGTGLQFSHAELSSIEASPFSLSNAPFSFLSEMLSMWQQFVPRDARGSKNCATLELLRTAVDNAGLGRTARELKLD